MCLVFVFWCFLCLRVVCLWCFGTCDLGLHLFVRLHVRICVFVYLLLVCTWYEFWCKCVLTLCLFLSKSVWGRFGVNSWCSCVFVLLCCLAVFWFVVLQRQAQQAARHLAHMQEADLQVSY